VKEGSLHPLIDRHPSRRYGAHLRVLILTSDYPPCSWSGIAAAVREQALALAERGLDVHVITTAVSSDRERASSGVPHVHHLARDRFPLEIESGDVVHLHSLALAELAIELTRRFTLPLIYTAHALLEIELDERARDWIALQRKLFATASRVIFVSNAEARSALRLVPELAARSAVLHNAVAPPPEPAHAYDAHGPIVFAGRFTRTKGIDLLLDVVPPILASTRARFVIAGGHGERDLHVALHALARRSPERCSITSWLDQTALETLFAQAALVLMPSRYEPFGMVALEAMRSGAPLLSSTCGGLAEIVQPGSGGITVEQLDAAAWIDAIQRLLADADLRRRLHALGPPYVARHFDRRVLGFALADLLHTATPC
jgi:glycogen(starch) synthase